MTILNEIKRGTVLKMKVGFSCPSNPSVTLDSCNWVSEWTTGGRVLRIIKPDHAIIGGDYVAMVDTSLMERGELKMRLWINIPDEAASEGVRPDYEEYDTGLWIK